MDKICPVCTEGKIIRKTVSIPIGRKRFETEVDFCELCKYYALTPAIRKAMDNWGNSFTTNFIDIQPFLKDVVHKCLDEQAEKYAIQKAALIRAFTWFYLNELLPDPNFEEIEKIVKESQAFLCMKDREKSVIAIPIRYRIFRRINMASKVHKKSDSQIMEDAVTFCVALKYLKDPEKLKKIIEKLDKFVGDWAMIA